MLSKTLTRWIVGQAETLELDTQIPYVSNQCLDLRRIRQSVQIERHLCIDQGQTLWNLQIVLGGCMIILSWLRIQFALQAEKGKETLVLRIHLGSLSSAFTHL